MVFSHSQGRRVEPGWLPFFFVRCSNNEKCRALFENFAVYNWDFNHFEWSGMVLPLKLPIRREILLPHCAEHAALRHDIIIAHKGLTICPPLTPIRTRGVRMWRIRAADALIGTKFQNLHLKAKCGFEIQVQNLKISNAITKRENPNLDSELDAKIMINWKGFPQFVLIIN